MNFGRIDRAIEACKKHLDDTKTRSTEVETQLAGYLLVLISAEFELRVGALIEARAARSRDKQLRNFVTHAVYKIVRGPKIDQITGILNAFHRGCSQAFHDTAGDQAKLAYDSILTDRHDFVHEAKCNATIGDVETFFNDARGVF